MDTETVNADVPLDVDSAAEAIMALDAQPRDDQGRFAANEVDEPEAPVDEVDEAVDQKEADAPEAEEPSVIETGTPEWDALKDRKVKLKVGEDEVEITLGEAASNGWREERYQAEMRGLAEGRKEAHAATERVAQREAATAQAATYIQHHIQKAISGISDQTISSLYAIDPGAAEVLSAQRDLLAKGSEQITELTGGLSQQMQAEQAQVGQAAMARFEQELPTAIPTWTDSAVRQRESADILAMLRTEGFQDHEIGQILPDTRTMRVLRKAYLYDKAQEGVEQIKKQAQTPPKAGKPRRGKVSVQKARQADAQKRLQQSGSVDDAAALLLARSQG